MWHTKTASYMVKLVGAAFAFILAFFTKMRKFASFRTVTSIIPYRTFNFFFLSMWHFKIRHSTLDKLLTTYMYYERYYFHMLIFLYSNMNLHSTLLPVNYFLNHVWKEIFIFINNSYKQNISVPATQGRRKNWIPYKIKHAKKP